MFCFAVRRIGSAPLAAARSVGGRAPPLRRPVVAASASVAAVGAAGCWWKESAPVPAPRVLSDDQEVSFWEATHIQFNRYWRQATATPESRLLWGIVGVNCGVYALWKITNPATRLHFMYRHFTTTTMGLRQGRVHTLITSSFSHMGAVHLGLNMYPLVHFGSVLLVTRRPLFFNPIDAMQLRTRTLSRGELVYLYALGAVLGAVVNALVMAPLMPAVPALGASNAVFAIVTYFCLVNPEQRLRVMFSVDTDAQTLVKWFVYINLAGTVLNAVGLATGIAWAGHLGGCAAGYWLYGQRRRALGLHGGWWDDERIAPLLDATFPSSLVAKMP